MENPRVVAIGASAGGLGAFRELIENLPMNTNMAFVLLSHILRGSKSLLSEILARSTKMPVVQVTDNTGIQATHIYVLPADKFMEISGGTTMAQIPNSASSQSMPINAINIDHVDYILTPKEIAQQLASISWRDKNILKTPLKVLWTKNHATLTL